MAVSSSFLPSFPELVSSWAATQLLAILVVKAKRQIEATAAAGKR
jgi:hypothetical protein